MLNVPIKQNISSVWLYKCMMGGGGERQMIPRQIKNITTANFWQGWYKTFSLVSIFASCNKFSSRNIDQSRNLDFVFLRFANFDKSQETPCVSLGTGPLWSETLLCFESNQSLDTSSSPQHHPQGDNSKEKILHFWIKDADIHIYFPMHQASTEDIRLLFPFAAPCPDWGTELSPTINKQKGKHSTVIAGGSKHLMWSNTN